MHAFLSLPLLLLQVGIFSLISSQTFVILWWRALGCNTEQGSLSSGSLEAGVMGKQGLDSLSKWKLSGGGAHSSGQIGLFPGPPWPICSAILCLGFLTCDMNGSYLRYPWVGRQATKATRNTSPSSRLASQSQVAFLTRDEKEAMQTKQTQAKARNVACVLKLSQRHSKQVRICSTTLRDKRQPVTLIF